MANKRNPSIMGVVPAIYTTFKEDLSIDEKSLHALADRMASTDGVGAVFCTGHAGEVASLSMDEQKRVIRCVAEAVGGRMPVMAGVYSDHLETAIQLAKNAKEAGASVVTIFPPNAAAGGMGNSEIPFRWFEAIVGRAGIKACVFQFSIGEGLGYSTDTLVRLATLPEVVAVKEGSGNPRQYEDNVVALSQLDAPVTVLTSNNEWWLADLALGGDGVLSGSGPVLAREQAEMYGAISANDLEAARQVQARIRPLLRVFYRPPFIDSHTRMKVALVAMGLLPRATVRPPLMPLTEQEQKEVVAAVKAVGLLN